jgi:hypothetical protein
VLIRTRSLGATWEPVSGFNLIYIAAIANSHVFTANARYVFGDLRTWGWITLIIGVLQLLAAAGVLAGNQAARSSLNDHLVPAYEATVAVIATVTLGIMLLCLACAGRWVLDRRRLADWEAAWAAAGPQWTRRFRSRGLAVAVSTRCRSREEADDDERPGHARLRPRPGAYR